MDQCTHEVRAEYWRDFIKAGVTVQMNGTAHALVGNTPSRLLQ